MRRLGILGVTLLGLGTLYGALGSFVGSLQLFSVNMGEEMTSLQVALIVGPALATVGLSIVLVVWRERIATALFRDEPVDIVVSPLPILRMILIALGLLIAVNALSDLTWLIVQPVAQSLSDRLLFGVPSGSTPTFSLVARAVPQVVELLIGWALTAFSAPISLRLWDSKHQQPVSTDAGGPRCLACGTSYALADYVPGSEARCVECGSPLDLRSV